MYSSGCDTGKLSVELREVGIAQQVQARNQVVCNGLKRGEVRAVDRFGIGQGNTQSVFLLAVLPEFIMQMRPGSQSGHAHVTNHFALRNMLALVQALGEARQVPVDRGVATLMVYHDDVAVTALSSDYGNDSVSGHFDFGTHGRGKISTLMGAPFFEYRMKSGEGKA